MSCQFTKRCIRHRAPLRIRQLPKPHQHLFADFLGSVFGKYYILVLVDCATGYTILISTHGTDAATIVDSILYLVGLQRLNLIESVDSTVKLSKH